MNRRLIELAVRRVRSGDLTERGLARLAGLSQPHLHNVLKGIRSLSNDTADQLMRGLGINVKDLLWTDSSDSATDVRTIPVVKYRIGPGNDSVLSVFRGAAPFLASRLATLVNPVAALLAPDLVMPAALAANDLVLLDQNPALRSNIHASRLWVVSEAEGLRVRYLRRGGSLLYIANELTLNDPRGWQPVPLQGRNILDVVRARIVWTSREIETETPGSPDPSGGGD